MSPGAALRLQAAELGRLRGELNDARRRNRQLTEALREAAESCHDYAHRDESKPRYPLRAPSFEGCQREYCVRVRRTLAEGEQVRETTERA